MAKKQSQRRGKHKTELHTRAGHPRAGTPSKARKSPTAALLPKDAVLAPAAARQIVVLGMHRSGTSALTGALARMGIFVGDEAELTAKSWENAAGFFERRDARKICDTLLHSSGADWWKISSFDADNANYEAVSVQRLTIRELVASLNQHGTWALKEPRLCFLLPLFQSALSNPLVVAAIRHPVEIARSLRRRNGFPIQAGLALWEAYAVSLLRVSWGIDRVFVDFQELIRDPGTTLDTLADELARRGIRPLDVRAGVESVQPSLRREWFDASTDAHLLSPAQMELWTKLSGARDWRAPPRLSSAALSVLREFEADEAARQEARASIKSLTAKATALQTSDAESKAAAQQRATETKDLAKQLNEATAQSAKLMRDLEARSAATKSLQGDLDRTRQSLTASEAQVSLLRTQLAESQYRHSEQAARIAAEVRRVEELRAELSARDAQRSEVQSRLAELQGRHAEQSSRLEAEVLRAQDLQDALSAREAQVSELRTRLAELEMRYASQADRLAVELRGNEQRSRDLSARGSQIAALDTELAELRGRYGEQSVLLDAERQSSERLREELASREVQLAEERAAQEALRSRYGEQSVLLDAERQNSERLRNELASQELQGVQQRAAQQTLRGRCAESEEKLLHADAELSAQRSLLSKLQVELDELRGRYAEQLERLTVAGYRTDAALADLAARNARVEELEAALSDAQRGRADAERRCVGLERSSADAQRSYEEQGALLGSERRRVEDLLAKVSAHDSARSELRLILESAEDDNARLKTELSSKSSRLSKLEYEHTKQTERIADVTERLKAERKKRRALDARVERQRARIKLQSADLSSIADSRDALAARLAAIESSRSWQVVAAVARVRRRLAFSNQAALESPRTESLAPSSARGPHASVAKPVRRSDVTPAAGALAAQALPVSPPSPRQDPVKPVKSKLELVAPGSVKRKLPITALVVTWDVGHNPLGRSYMLAEVVDRVVRHTVVTGFQFPRYGTRVWEPLRNARLPVIRIPGQAFPDFIDVVNHISSVVRPDVVIACKPRLPSLQLALRIKERTGCPLILDIDDHELSFFQDQTSLSLDALESMPRGALSESTEPYGQSWTRLCESLLNVADARLVSNTALQERFGGHLVPHVRDEAVFDRNAIADRAAIRRRLGIPTEAKVVLFFGTPRKHKGVGALADAVSRISDPDFRLVVVGRGSDPSVTAMLDQKAPGKVIELPNQPFSAIPEVLACADVVALPQDVDHPVSLYQLPAKAIDALAMGVPLLVSRTPPLMDLVRHGVASLIDVNDLAQQLEKAARQGVSLEQAKAHRETFLRSYSYSSAAVQMHDIIDGVVRSGPRRGLAISQRLESAQRNVLGAKARKASNAEGGAGHDVVLFWKQNDTTLYGRRHDMVIKYLASRPDVRRVLVFDAPISIHALLQFRKDVGQRTQHRHVYVRTEEKLLGLRDKGKVRYRVFAYQPGIYGRGTESDGKPPLADAYMEFLRQTFDNEEISADRSVFWFYPKDEFIPKIVDTFKPRRCVVDVVDDHRAWPNVSEQEVMRLTDHYREVLSLADFAFANCEPVCESMRAFSPGIRLIPNGCDVDATVTEPDDSPEFDQLKAWRGKVIGFVGNLESKIDIELLDRVATEFRECLLVLAGSTHANPEVVELARHPNVLMPGVVPYDNVGAWIRRFDVAMIPHRKSSLTKHMNPLKLFVYAAHQVPVVSTDVPNLDERLENLFVAQSEQEFIERIRAILSARLSPIGGVDYRVKNSWESRFKDAVDGILEPPGVLHASISR